MTTLSPESILPSTARGAQAATTTTRRPHMIAYALFTAASNLRFTAAVWLIYLAAHGYSPLAIGLFEMLFHLTKFVAEVPTGAFADLVGRRASLIAACIVGAVAELLFLAPSPWIVALSLALSGLSYAFRGGADTALLWG